MTPARSLKIKTFGQEIVDLFYDDDFFTAAYYKFSNNTDVREYFCNAFAENIIIKRRKELKLDRRKRKKIERKAPYTQEEAKVRSATQTKRFHKEAAEKYGKEVADILYSKEALIEIAKKFDHLFIRIVDYFAEVYNIPYSLVICSYKRFDLYSSLTFTKVSFSAQVRKMGYEMYDLFNDDEFMTNAFLRSTSRIDMIEYLCCSFNHSQIKKRLNSLGYDTGKKWRQDSVKKKIGDISDVLYDKEKLIDIAKKNNNNLRSIYNNVFRKHGITRSHVTCAYKRFDLYDSLEVLDSRELRNIELKERIGKDNYEKYMDDEYIKQRNREQLAKELGVSESAIQKRCREAGVPMKKNASHKENCLAEFVESHSSGGVIRNSRNIISPYELDIYLPERKLAIEFNGVFWHSFDHLETTEERNYHRMKTKMCREQGIHLFHIFENQWLENRELIESMILSRLGIFTDRIYARKCEVREVTDQDTIKKFLTDNHIQGYTTTASIALGLYHDDRLVSLMTFSRPRFNKKYDWELMRFCSLRGFQIVGGASKLLTHFKRSHSGASIVSYSDNSYSDGGVYRTLGFDHVGGIPVRYSYVDGVVVYNRMSFQKKMLPDKLNFFDPNLTEAENMFNNGYRRIWDAGKMVWSLKITDSSS